MDFIRAHRWLGWFLIVAGGVMMAGSCFDRGIMDLDDTRLTTKVCSDYPVGQAPVDCPTTTDVLDTNNGVDHWLLFVVGLLFLVSGLAIVTGLGPFKNPAATHGAPTGGMMALVVLQAPSDVDVNTCDGWVTCHPLATAVIAFIVIAIAVGIWQKNRGAS